MSDRNEKHTAAEDYLAHLDWHTHYRTGKLSWTSTEPRWKYKIAYPHRPIMPPAVRSLIVYGIIALAGFGLYRASKLEPGLAMYLGFVFLFIGGIIFFASRDASK